MLPRFAAIVLMIGIDALIWAVIRYYVRTGRIIAFPFSISRDRTPRWFSINMALLWLSLALSITFTAVVSTNLLLGY